MNTNVELLAPAGSFDAARAAFQYGADAVYLGMPRFSARAEAVNLSVEEVRLLRAYADALSPRRKIYITFNTLVTDEELPEALKTLSEIAALRPDGLIVQDLGVAALVREYFPSLPLHASTQLVAHHAAGVRALKALGFVRVVLARELSIEEITEIVKTCGVEIEVFIHGALCYSLSGLCLFSALTAGRSGNRGACAYCCRESMTDAHGKTAFPFSMKDLFLAPTLDALVATGVCSLKIEGRMKSPLYVASVTDYYRHLLDGTYSPEEEARARENLQTVFCREQTSLYAEGLDATPRDVIDPISVGHRGALIGTVKAVVTGRDGGRWLRFKTRRALEKHDGLQIVPAAGEKTFGFPVDRMHGALSRTDVFELPAGSDVEVRLPTDQLVPTLPVGAAIYCSASQAVRRAFPVAAIRPAEYATGVAVDVHVTLTPDHLMASVGDVSVTVQGTFPPAQQVGKTSEAVRKAFERLGGTAWRLGALSVTDTAGVYAPLSYLNTLRRELVAALNARNVTAVPQLKLPPVEAWRGRAQRVLKVRLDQVSAFENELCDERVVAIGHASAAEVARGVDVTAVRLALPVFTRTADYAALEDTVRTLVARGAKQWEAADVSGLALLRACGVEEMTVDWTAYAFNRMAHVALRAAGARRVVLSPESSVENLKACATADAEVITWQHTPLFLSVTEPCGCHDAPFTDRRGRAFESLRVDNLWVTRAVTPRRTDAPFAAWQRVDHSWD